MTSNPTEVEGCGTDEDITGRSIGHPQVRWDMQWPVFQKWPIASGEL